jgi:hypothetical protein
MRGIRRTMGRATPRWARSYIAVQTQCLFACLQRKAKPRGFIALHDYATERLGGLGRRDSTRGFSAFMRKNILEPV